MTRLALALSLVALPLAAQDAARAVAGGGITVPGWAGAVDAQEAKGGATIANAKFAPEGSGIRVTTGPASTYWQTKTKLTGDYTVKATFREPQYMNINDHPHPYGIAVAVDGLDGATGQALYCAAYGNGTYIVRGFGPAPFRIGQGRPVASDAVKKAAGQGQAVSQDVAITVKGDRVSCVINGTEVAGFSKAEAVGAGKLRSTDGYAGLRFGHNTDVLVTGFSAAAAGHAGH